MLCNYGICSHIVLPRYCRFSYLKLQRRQRPTPRTRLRRRTTRAKRHSQTVHERLLWGEMGSPSLLVQPRCVHAHRRQPRLCLALTHAITITAGRLVAIQFGHTQVDACGQPAAPKGLFKRPRHCTPSGCTLDRQVAPRGAHQRHCVSRGHLACLATH